MEMEQFLDLTISDKIFGNGQCGTMLAKQHSKFFKNTKTVVSNTAVDNIKLFSIEDVMLLGVDGTGNDPDKGEMIARNKIDKINKFLFEKYEDVDGEICGPRIVDDDEYIIIYTSGGGGSGNGITRVIVELLVELNKKILVIISTPKKNEGIKRKNNTIKLINWFIENIFLKDIDYVNVILADNQLLYDRFKMKKTHYDRINYHIINPLKMFYDFTFKSNYDFLSGNNANIDMSDLKRVLYNKNSGFVDFRYFQLDEGIDDEFIRKLNTESMYYGSFDINTTTNYILAIVLPKGSDKHTMNTKAELISKRIEVMTRTPNSYVSYFYSSNVDKITGYMICAGLKKSKAMIKLVNSIKRDHKKLEKKSEVEFVKLETGIDI